MLNKVKPRIDNPILMLDDLVEISEMVHRNSYRILDNQIFVAINSFDVYILIRARLEFSKC